MRQRRQPEIIAGRVNSDGSIAAGDGFTVQKTAVGAYTLTITASDFRMIGLSAVIADGGFNGLSLSGIGARSATIATFQTNQAASGSDHAWTFVAVGVQQ